MKATINTQQLILRFFMALLGMAILSVLTSCNPPIPNYPQTYEELKTLGISQYQIYSDTVTYKLRRLPNGDSVVIYTDTDYNPHKLYVFRKGDSFKRGSRFYLQD